MKKDGTLELSFIGVSTPEPKREVIVVFTPNKGLR